MGKQARLKSARKNQRSRAPGLWALDSKNNHLFSPRNIRRIYALTALTRKELPTDTGRIIEVGPR